MNDNQHNSTEVQRVEVSKPIKWSGYESIKSEHATNLVVQQHGGEFILYFFEVQPPFTIGTPQEQTAQLERLSHIEMKCVAKIVMSVPNAATSANALIEQLNNFGALMQQAMGGKENATNG